MIGSLIILTVSFVLFAYWFRYTCLLILSAKPAKDYSEQVAANNRMAFPAVRRQLQAELAGGQLHALQASLDHDYRVINYLLRHAKDLDAEGAPVEQLMLAADYQVMKLLYAVSRWMGLPGARRALVEMADILSYFAHAIGERTVAAPGAVSR